MPWTRLMLVNRKQRMPIFVQKKPMKRSVISKKDATIGE
jgi:hypothetical protein